MKNKTATKLISVIICISLIIGFGIGQCVSFSAAADSASAEVMVGSTKAIKTTSGVFLQSYVTVRKGVSTQVNFYAAQKLDVYAFESTTGGDALDVRADKRETSMRSADEEGRYLTYTSDPNAIPYQAFEVDVDGITGEIFFGFEGTTADLDSILVMQVYDPASRSWFETSRDTYHNGTVTLTYTADAQKYAENGRVRYRVTFPDASARKYIYLHYAAAGCVNREICYATKTKTSAGNSSFNMKNGTFEPDGVFCVEASNEDGTAYSLPVCFTEKDGAPNQDKLWHFSINFNGDTGTCRNMIWATEEDMPTVVQLIPYGPIEQDFSNATEYIGTTVLYDDYIEKNYYFETRKKYNHYVTVDGLEPGREYWYRYGNGEDIWSAPCYLRTDDGDSSFAFVIGGDPQPEASAAQTEEDIAVAYGERLKEMTYSCNEARRLVGAEFVVCTGDETDAAGRERCWDWYYKSNQYTFRSMTLASTMGNHDFRYDWACGYAFPYWLRNHNYVDPLGEYEHGWFYSFDYGNAHFAVINGNIAAANNSSDLPENFKVDFAVLRDKMLNWLDNDLENSDADFKIVISHQGMYSFPCHTYDAETKELRARLVPILDKHDVDIMFQGHDHVWIRTNTMQAGKKITQNSGTVTDIVDGSRVVYTVDPVGTTYTNCGSFTGSKYHDPNPASFASLISVAVSSQPELPTFSTVEIENGKLMLKGWARTESGECKRISEFTCYPAGSAADDGFNIINSSFYDKVNERIKKLPETVTLDDADEINALREICDKENEAILTRFVPDYSELTAAENALDELYAQLNKGDFDGDGQITVTDALAALRIAVRFVAETPEAISVGDVDDDGHITVSDALIILRKAAKLADTL